MSVQTFLILMMIGQPLIVTVSYFVGVHVGWLIGYRRARKTAEEVIRDLMGKP